MTDVIMLKLGELVLKGQNRRRFEDKMLGKIKRILGRVGSGKVRSCQSTVYVEDLDESVDYDELMTVLGRVFGIVALTRAKGLQINGKTVFGRFVLDQGFYPDGIITAPSDAALIFDIEAR